MKKTLLLSMFIFGNSYSTIDHLELTRQKTAQEILDERIIDTVEEGFKKANEELAEALKKETPDWTLVDKAGLVAPFLFLGGSLTYGLSGGDYHDQNWYIHASCWIGAVLSGIILGVHRDQSQRYRIWLGEISENRNVLERLHSNYKPSNPIQPQ